MNRRVSPGAHGGQVQAYWWALSDLGSRARLTAGRGEWAADASAPETPAFQMGVCRARQLGNEKCAKRCAQLSRLCGRTFYT